jgi:hypothetical protein
MYFLVTPEQCQKSGEELCKALERSLNNCVHITSSCKVQFIRVDQKGTHLDVAGVNLVRNKVSDILNKTVEAIAV